MSALGQKRTLDIVLRKSALPPKADIASIGRDVRFTPKSRHRSARRRLRSRDCASCRRNIRGVGGDLDFIALSANKNSRDAGGK